MNEERTILVAAEAGIAVRTLDDIANLLGACFGAEGLLLSEEDLGPEFFRLRSGLAGELLQKFVNYHMRVAIVVPDPARYGERFSELAYEHATHPLIRFVRSRADADAWLET
jgi:hypothetical protein